MPITDLELPLFITYSAYPMLCTVRNVTTGLTLATGLFMLKRNKDDDDTAALITKTITPALVVGEGQITDTGGDTIGEALFDITADDTGGVPANGTVQYYWGIKFILSDGTPKVYAQGTVRPIQGIVKATV